ncbi:MAG: acetolactate decarboxylase [Lentisphaeria bacterium]|nr:acetolactate decarboxylase [Lentisphaeria bacterium]
MSKHEPVKFTQISLFDVLLCGRYGGVVSVAEVKSLGGLAIATMDRLDGEMQMIDGVVYQACADGTVRLPGDDETVPFGTVADFRPEEELPLEAVPDYAAFESRMRSCFPRTNRPLAVRFTGSFRQMKVRSVRRQEKDGVGLADAARNEAVFEWNGISGDLVGFRLPEYLRGVNAPGWHLHFMDSDRRRGGHVVNFSIGSGRLYGCCAEDYRIRLPESPDPLAGLELGIDRSADLKRAEAER